MHTFKTIIQYKGIKKIIQPLINPKINHEGPSFPKTKKCHALKQTSQHLWRFTPQ